MRAVGAVLGPRQQALVVSWDGVAAHFGFAFDVCRTWNRPLLTRITRLKQAGSITSSGIETILGNPCVQGNDFHAAVAGGRVAAPPGEKKHQGPARLLSMRRAFGVCRRCGWQMHRAFGMCRRSRWQMHRAFGMCCRCRWQMHRAFGMCCRCGWQMHRAFVPCHRRGRRMRRAFGARHPATAPPCGWRGSLPVARKARWRSSAADRAGLGARNKKHFTGTRAGSREKNAAGMKKHIRLP